MKNVFRYSAAMLVLGTLGCQQESSRSPATDSSPNPDRGKTAIARYGCASCHTIPGIRGANGLVGPSLDRIASRTYIAGVLANTHDNMLRWIHDPPKVDDKTAMPDLEVTEQDARDIASYLYTLR
jgi:cytochrome c1